MYKHIKNFVGKSKGGICHTGKTAHRIF